MDRRDLSELLVFQAVAEAGSFTRAASRLGRTQSGISQAVSSLESRLGVTLVARSTKSSRLTGINIVRAGCSSVVMRNVPEGWLCPAFTCSRLFSI